MTDNRTKVPTSRIGRFGRMSRLASRVAIGMATEGVRQVAQGNLPRLQHMVLTPANARRLTSELAKMRGAAMKLGQILSMDAGDVIPEELAEILSHLRADAHIMPAKQLEQQLVSNLGIDWRDRFATFEPRPIAAASIGQVHKATTHEGNTLALKVQYPGIRDSIDSDVQNLAGLLSVTGLIPKGLDTAPLLEEVKQQLHDEANYLLEADHLASFGALLADDERFIVPALEQAYSTESILAMEYVEAEPIEDIIHSPRGVRDDIMHALFELALKELFELHLMQTDANFANYRYQHHTGRIVLLDFGATRRFNAAFAAGYKDLIRALLAQDDTAILQAAQNLGYHSDAISPGYQHLLLSVFHIVGEIFASTEPYDFKRSNVWSRINAINTELFDYKTEWQAPPSDALYFHRKLGGLFMLASRIDAKVAMRPLIEPCL